MKQRRPALLVLALVAPLLALVPVAAGATADEDPAAAATRDLRADAEAGVTLKRAEDGQVAFVGTPARGSVDNPEVAAGDSVAAAAREHLDRYGAALEPATGSTFARTGSVRTTSGVDLVRYQQAVDGVRVLGGQVVVGLDDDRDLRSLSSSVSDADVQTEPATVPAAEAAATARAAVAGRGSAGTALTVTDLGRWLLDPSVVGLDLPGGVRTVRRFEVSNGASVRELVLVDDRTGTVVLKSSMIADLNRVVCDQQGLRGPETTCTTGIPGRVEGGPSSLVAEVNNAYNFAGETSALYAAAAPPAYADLTELLGVDVAGTKRLASTVRYCSDAQFGTPPNLQYVDDCPYPNAFWNGEQMFYGNGFAAADDVVAHEMTHGYTERTSGLFYWGQSGAINESLSDVIGEIVDHRNGGDDDSAWRLGEDIGTYGPFRSMKTPSAAPFLDPDAMTSTRYDADTDISDNGGVHSNSGVGNKTAYLISQGTSGLTVHGQNFTGIDADAALSKTAVLYLEVIPRLVAASDYADLAATLDQTCQDLVAQGTVRGVTFSQADCAKVHQATLATQLTSPPANIAKPADASTACPTGTKRVLFDSEAGDPTATMTADPTPDPAVVPDPAYAWHRDATAFRSDTWTVFDPEFAAVNSLKVATPVTLPAGQASYLSFRGWWVNDYVPAGQDFAGDYDGGTVELRVNGAAPITPVAGWVNGPNGTLTRTQGTADYGKKAFVRDSHGWVGSRLDLSAYNGLAVRPQFTFRSDEVVGHIGWFLEDITVYTCDAGAPSAARGIATTGTGTSANSALAQRVTWAAPAVNAAAVTAYRIYVDGRLVRTVGASARSADITGFSRTARHAFAVRAVGAPGYPTAAVSASTVPTSATLSARRSGTKVILSGVLKKAGAAYPARRVQLERRSGSGWVKVSSVLTKGPKGAFTFTVKRPKAASYRVRFVGAPAVTGTFSPTRRK